MSLTVKYFITDILRNHSNSQVNQKFQDFNISNSNFNLKKIFKKLKQ